jgi:uncharacterized protein YjbI with pentapeptide repeats
MMDAESINNFEKHSDFYRIQTNGFILFLALVVLAIIPIKDNDLFKNELFIEVPILGSKIALIPFLYVMPLIINGYYYLVTVGIKKHIYSVRQIQKANKKRRGFSHVLNYSTFVITDALQESSLKKKTLLVILIVYPPILCLGIMYVRFLDLQDFSISLHHFLNLIIAIWLGMGLSRNFKSVSYKETLFKQRLIRSVMFLFHCLVFIYILLVTTLFVCLKTYVLDDEIRTIIGDKKTSLSQIVSSLLPRLEINDFHVSADSKNIETTISNRTFCFSIISNSDLEHFSFSNVDFNAVIIRGTNCNNMQIIDCNFFNSRLGNISMSNTYLSQVKFLESRFVQCHFDQSTISGCTYRNCSYDGFGGNSTVIEYSEFFRDSVHGGEAISDESLGYLPTVPTDFFNCRFISSTFSGCNVLANSFKFCVLSDCEFKNLHINNGMTPGGDFFYSLFDNVSMEKCHVNYLLNSCSLELGTCDSSKLIIYSNIQLGRYFPIKPPTLLSDENSCKIESHAFGESEKYFADFYRKMIIREGIFDPSVLKPVGNRGEWGDYFREILIYLPSLDKSKRYILK